MTYRLTALSTPSETPHDVHSEGNLLNQQTMDGTPESTLPTLEPSKRCYNGSTTQYTNHLIPLPMLAHASRAQRDMKLSTTHAIDHNPK
jgi:hypothetical protein